MAPLKHFISMTPNCLLCCFSFLLSKELTCTSKTTKIYKYTATGRIPVTSDTVCCSEPGKSFLYALFFGMFHFNYARTTDFNERNKKEEYETQTTRQS